MRATIFLISDFVGAYDNYLTWPQAAEMQANGIDMASHTMSHMKLTALSDDELDHQLAGAKTNIEAHLHNKVISLAYPGGVYDQRVMEAAEKAGYQAAFTIKLGRDNDDDRLMAMHRIPLFSGRHSFLRFWLRLKCTQSLMAVQNLKDYLNHTGAAGLAKLIYVP